MWYSDYGYDAPALNLHDDDGSHQSGLGSYLAAAVIYETITGRSSVGNSYAGSYQNGVTGQYQGQSIMKLLQNQATATTGVPLPVDSDGDTIDDSLDNCT